MAAFAEPLADLIFQFGREGPRTDARRISLGNPEHIAGTGRADTGTAGSGARNRVRAGDKGIGAMIDIKQHTLCAFEQDTLAIAARFVEPFPNRLGILQHAVGYFLQVIEQPLAVDGRFAEARPERVMVCAQPVKLRSQIIEMREIADPDRAAPDLVLIGRSDATPGRADLALAAGILAHCIQIPVDWQNQRAGFGNAEIVCVDGDALAFELLDLVAQMPGIKHHAVADDRQCPPHDAGR